MEYRWNSEVWTEAVALPAAVVDRHIRLAGPTQLKVLLWLARRGQGTFDAAACAAAIGYSPADCADAMQYWLGTGMLTEGGEQAAPPPPEKPEKKVAFSPKIQPHFMTGLFFQ